MVATIGRPRKYGFFEPPVNIVKETPLCDRMKQKLVSTARSVIEWCCIRHLLTHTGGSQFECAQDSRNR